MASIGYRIDCPRCGKKDAVDVHERYCDKKERCDYCGYFRETISTLSYENRFTICNDLWGSKERSFNANDLDPMDQTRPFLIQGFKCDNGMYYRTGVISADKCVWDWNLED